jgi:hypothetical protein
MNGAAANALERLAKHAELGLRWIKCGWRLFLRNPWLLGGMGFCCSALVAALAQIPLIGGPFLGLLAPAAVASFYIAIDGISKQKIKLPQALRLSAIKQSPRELLNISREERQLMQVLVMGLYALVTVVLTDILTWLIAGTNLASPLQSLSFAALLQVMLAVVLRFAIYLVVAASLVFSLPLSLLQKEALVPASVDSVRHAGQYAVALLVIVALLLVPLLLGAVISFYSTWLAYVIGFVVGAFTLPICLCSFYCSYRTMFSANQPVQHVDTNFKRAKYV